MHSPADDRTARARIRDESLRLFADRGADAVSMRDIAAAAGVSPALVVRHFGSKDGLVEAVDSHVVAALDAVLTAVTEQSAANGLGPSAVPSMLDGLATHLPPDSPIPAYLGRLLTTGGPLGTTLFQRLYEMSRKTLAAMVDAGVATAGDDPDVRAAVLLVNDLAVLTLRDRLTEVLGDDPLTPAGMTRWAGEVLTVYRDGLTAHDRHDS